MSPPPTESAGAPDPGAFLNPWGHGCLIRYLAWLRQAYGAVPLPPPTGRSTGRPGVPILEVFVQPRLARSQGAARSVDVFDLLEQNRQVVVLGGPGSGRSTLLSWLVHGLTDPGRNPVIERLGRMVPIVLPVRALGLQASTRTFPALLERLAELPFWYDGMTELLAELLPLGQAVFVVDDLDYPADPGVHEALREAVLDGIWRHGRCTWIATAEPRRYASLPLAMDGVDARRVPAALRRLVVGRVLQVPAWHLEPFDAEQVRAYAHRWLALTQRDPGAVAERVQDFEDALDDSPKARELVGNPGLLALLAVVYAARGDVPPDRATLIDWLVAAWMAALDGAPGTAAVPHEARRSWVEALARAAEAARAAAARRTDAFDGAYNPATFNQTPSIGLASAVDLLRRAIREAAAPDPGDAAALQFVQAVSVRPGILIGRGDGLAFVRADHQRFLAALHLATDLGGDDTRATAAEAALSTLRSWSSEPAAQDDLVELFGILGDQGDLVERVADRILGDAGDRSLDELAELAPLALALQQGNADVPAALRAAAAELVDEAVERWAVERQRVPTWTRDLRPVAAHTELHRLDLSGCAAITDLAPLKPLTRLQRIELRDCAKVEDLTPLSRMDELQWADLRGCTGVSDVEPISRLEGLRWLDLGGCTTLTDLSSLANLPNLQALVLHGCAGITDLSPLGAARSLRYLVLTDCVGVRDLRPLKVLEGGGKVWVRGTSVRYVPRDLRWEVIGLGE